MKVRLISIFLIFLVITLISACNKGNTIITPVPVSTAVPTTIIEPSTVPTVTSVSENLTPTNKPDNRGEKPVSLSSAYTDFGFKVFSELLKEDKGKNIFISPSSIAIALAMTYNGADKETKDAMAKTLEIDGMSLDELNSANNQLMKSLENLDPKVELSIANSLWCKPDIKFKEDFIKRCKDAYEAEIRNEFNVAVINGWIKEKTKGKIENALDQIPDNALLYIINAIYFKGSWTREFDKKLTKDEDFFLTDGAKKKVPLMSQSGSYNYYQGDKFQALSLPYGDGKLSMYIFLPDKSSSLEEFQKNLTAENWEKWIKSFNKKEGDILLPRFKIKYTVLLNNSLSKIGMAIAFDQDNANFKNMCDLVVNNVYISRVIHKTFVDVNEEGTEAAAVTIVEMRGNSVEPPTQRFYMRADRPFLFVIRDNTTGTILFMGSIVEPE